MIPTIFTQTPLKKKYTPDGFFGQHEIFIDEVIGNINYLLVNNLFLN